MQLLTNEIKKNLPALYATESTPLGEKKAVAKFFNPIGAGTWLVIEGEEQKNGDYLFFGYINLYEWELGYFTLSEISEIKLKYGLGIERDRHFYGGTLKEILGEGHFS